MANCLNCGAILPAQKTGRPRIRCGQCTAKYRKDYKLLFYLKSKNPCASEAELKLLDLKNQALKDNKQLKAFLDWEHKYLKKHPGLFVIFSDLNFKKRESICSKVRRQALKDLAEYEFLSRKQLPATSRDQ